MHKMVSKPNLIADDNLNAKIEKIFNNSLFQKMAEKAEIISDASTEEGSPILERPSPLNTEKEQERFIRKVANERKPVLREDEELPHFGSHENKKKTKKESKSEKQVILDEITPEKSKEKGQAPLNTAEKANDSFGTNKKSQEDKSQESAKKAEEEKMPSVIVGEGDSGFGEGSQSLVMAMDNENEIDEYANDDDAGFVVQEIPEEHFEKVCKELASKYNYPARSIKPEPKTAKSKKKKGEGEADNEEDDENSDENSTSKNNNDSAVFDPALSKSKSKSKKPDGNTSATNKSKKEEKKGKTEIAKKDIGKDEAEDDIKKLERLIKKVDDTYKSKYLPTSLKFISQKDDYYPVEYDGTVFDTFNLRMVFDREKTGFEETKEFPIVINSIVAGRYQIQDYLGSAAFSKAIQVFLYI